MEGKKKLLVFCNDYLGGVANYHKYIITSDYFSSFDKKVIFTSIKGEIHTRLNEHFNENNFAVIEIDTSKNNLTERCHQIFNQFKEYEDAVIVTNFTEELQMLHYFFKESHKVVYVCHDEMYVSNALKYSFLINVFIAHNYEFYETLIDKLPLRIKDIFYLPYGVKVPPINIEQKSKYPSNLNIVFLARHHRLKGIYDIPKIDDILKNENVLVNWIILGDGPERKTFMNLVKERENFKFDTPSNDEIKDYLKKSDLFVLPSGLDGLPVAILEAMSFFVIPIIYRFNKGISSVLSYDANDIVDIGDYNAMANRVIFYHNNRENLLSNAQKAYDKINEHYNIEKQSEKYYHLYNSIESKSKTNVDRNNLNGKLNHPLLPKPIYIILISLLNLKVKVYNLIKKIIRK